MKACKEIGREELCEEVFNVKVQETEWALRSWYGGLRNTERKHLEFSRMSEDSWGKDQEELGYKAVNSQMFQTYFS